MQCLVLNDGMAVLRARLERDLARFSLNKFLNDLDAHPHLQFWIFDGAGNKKSRQEVYPEYKGKRKPSGPSIYEGMMLIKDALKLTKGVVIEVPGYEADDVIATLARRYQGKMPIVINTRDFDLRALCSQQHNILCTVEPKEHVPDHLIPLYKLFVGDPSDNIPGVKLFGEKAWLDAEIHELVALRDAVLNDRPLPPTDSIAESRRVWIDQNRDLFKAMHFCIELQTVPDDILEKHTVIGRSDQAARKELMGQFFL